MNFRCLFSRSFAAFTLLALTGIADAQTAPAIAMEGSRDAIHSGVGWYDQNGRMVSAHGGGVIKEGDRYYLFGEYKQDNSNEFAGFSCYSSSDLMNWKFEDMALPVQKDGLLGPNRVGERPKVLKCPKTGEFVNAENLPICSIAVGTSTAGPKLTGISLPFRLNRC